MHIFFGKQIRALNGTTANKTILPYAHSILVDDSIYPQQFHKSCFFDFSRTILPYAHLILVDGSIYPQHFYKSCCFDFSRTIFLYAHLILVDGSICPQHFHKSSYFGFVVTNFQLTSCHHLKSFHSLQKPADNWNSISKVFKGSINCPQVVLTVLSFKKLCNSDFVKHSYRSLENLLNRIRPTNTALWYQRPIFEKLVQILLILKIFPRSQRELFWIITVWELKL